MTKLYLDDERPTPPGWDRAYTASEAISALKGGGITHLSLDHDLGPAEQAGTGYDVATWLEQEAWTDPDFVPPAYISVHSANPVGRRRIEAAIQAMTRAMMER